MDNSLFSCLSRVKSLAFMLEKVSVEDLKTTEEKDAWLECFYMLKENVDKAYELCD